jgi:predicted CoA-binding protein
MWSIISGRLKIVEANREIKKQCERDTTMSTTPTPDTNICLQILQQYRHIAVVGISTDMYKPSYGVSAYMQRAGYDIIPINPRYAGQEILGKRVYASLAEAKEAGEPIEIVDVFRLAHFVPQVADDAISVGAKALWVQLGIRSDEAALKAHEAGMPYVQDKCIKVEHMLLFG